MADAGYKIPWICKKVIDDGRIPVLPYKRPMGKEGYFRPHEYVYDEYYDCVICPENQVLEYSTTDREGCREFKSKGYICEKCPNLDKCTNSVRHLLFDKQNPKTGNPEKNGINKDFSKEKGFVKRIFEDYSGFLRI